MLSVALALSTWKDRLAGRAVRVYSDNTVAEYAFKRGSAASPDHDALVHWFWYIVYELRLTIHIDRVPTECNIADLPSREEYWLLRQIGA